MPGQVFPVIYAADVERSAAFYTELLDFQELFRYPPEGEAGYVGLRRGDDRLGVVAAGWSEERLGMAVGSGLRFELYTYVDVVDDALAAARAAGAPVLREPEDMPWGERIAVIADPDGNPVTLAAPVGTAD
jgi:lactoylglutathione lyase